jgi:hypothetical protein
VCSAVHIRKPVRRSPALNAESLPHAERVCKPVRRVCLWPISDDDEASWTDAVEPSQHMHRIPDSLFGHETANVHERQFVFLERLIPSAEGQWIEAKRENPDSSGKTLGSRD